MILRDNLKIKIAKNTSNWKVITMAQLYMNLIRTRYLLSSNSKNLNEQI